MAPSKPCVQKNKPVIPTKTVLTKSGIISKPTSSLKLQRCRDINVNANQQRSSKLGPIVNHPAHKCGCGKSFNSIDVMRKHEQTHTPIKKTSTRADPDTENKSDISIMRSVMECASPKNALVSSAKKIAKKKVVAHGGVPLSDRMKRAILGANKMK